MVYIVMGVSGAGKTVIGNQLADALHLPFYDADQFHPVANIKKMKEGHALTDDDRKPWLQALAQKIDEWNHTGGAVLACSALKKMYRTMLRQVNKNVQFIYLKGTKSLIAGRMHQRSDHFMPETLLNSQFRTLEEPQNAITISADQPPHKIIKEIEKKLHR